MNIIINKLELILRITPKLFMENIPKFGGVVSFLNLSGKYCKISNNLQP